MRRVRRRCETWDVPIDLRNSALAQYRESSNLILAHFEKLHDLSRVLDIHCGRSHSLALTHAGEVWSLGMFHVQGGIVGSDRVGDAMVGLFHFHVAGLEISADKILHPDQITDSLNSLSFNFAHD